MTLRAGAVAQALLLPQAVDQPRGEVAAEDVVAQFQGGVVGSSSRIASSVAGHVDGVLLVRRVDALAWPP